MPFRPRTIRPKRAGLKRAPRKTTKRPAKVSQPMKSAITKIVLGNQETKYVATTKVSQVAVPFYLGAQSTYQQLINLLPRVNQSATTEQKNFTRIGDTIEPIKLRVHVQYTWHKDCSGSAQLFVKQFHVTNKSIKSNDLWTLATAATEQAKMLENGDGTTSYPDGRAPSYPDFYKPINKEVWTSHKGTRYFQMAKNSGRVQQSITHAGFIRGNPSLQDYPTSSNNQGCVSHSFDVPCPKKLKYDQNTSGYPSNFMPLFGSYFGITTNLDSDLEAYGPAFTPTYQPVNPPLLATVRVELWYKDA